jgi:RNA-directed DNA polymerase
MKKRTALLEKLKEMFRRSVSQPTHDLIEAINPVIAGWVNYFRVGHSRRCFAFVRQWIEKKVRRHIARAQGRRGYRWNRWSSERLYGSLGLYHNYEIRYMEAPKALAIG